MAPRLFGALVPPEYQWHIVVGGTILIAVIWILSKVRRFLRKRRPPVIHPSLQKYQYPGQATVEQTVIAAAIEATSGSAEMAGYKIVRQIETIFVDGFRRPEEAITALKAQAAEKGANGVVNVRPATSSSGKYSASGDAVVVEKSED